MSNNKMVACFLFLILSSTFVAAKNLIFSNPITSKFVLQPSAQLTMNTPSSQISSWGITDDNGNMSVPANTVYHITSDSVLDGQGNTITIGDYAQLFVDTDITLTIRNATIQYAKTNFGFPPIRLAAHGSKLALDNVKVVLDRDFNFKQGQLFVHNDVTMSGSSTFIYTSPVPSWITANSRLFFDLNTTFSIAPATFTDAPIDQTYVDCNFIKMLDKTSQLYLNGCSLMTTYTGCRFTKGTVTFDRTVNATSAANTTISSYSTQVGSSVTAGDSLYNMQWAPNGRFIAIVFKTTTDNLKIYRFDGSSTPVLVATFTTGTNCVDLAWSPDGNFIAIANDNSTDNFRIYQFDGSSKLTLIGTPIDVGTGCTAVTWSPDSHFIAVGTKDTSNNFHIYQFDGVSTPTIIGTAVSAGTSQIGDVAWSPDGRFIAVANFNETNDLRIYRFSKTSAPTLIGSAIDAGSQIKSIQWSPDSRFIAVGSVSVFNNLGVFYFNGSSTPVIVGSLVSADGSGVNSVDWSSDGHFIALGIFGSTSLIFLSVFRFDGTTAPTVISTPITGNGFGQCARWSPDNRFIATGFYPNTDNFRIYRVSYAKESTPQAFSKSIVFGDSVKGATYDADVTFLGKAHVKLNGQMNYDCVS